MHKLAVGVTLCVTRREHDKELLHFMEAWVGEGEGEGVVSYQQGSARTARQSDFRANFK